MSRLISEDSVPRALGRSVYGVGVLQRRPPVVGAAQFDIKVKADSAFVVTGDGQFIFVVPEDLNGKVLTGVAIYVTTVSSSGKPTVQIRNVTDAVDMLTTKASVDVSEFTSYAAAVPAVIDTANDDVATGDRIAIDVDIAGTGAKGLGVILDFA